MVATPLDATSSFLGWSLRFAMRELYTITRLRHGRRIETAQL
jgi:hypothetical protein